MIYFQSKKGHKASQEASEVREELLGKLQELEKFVKDRQNLLTEALNVGHIEKLKSSVDKVNEMTYAVLGDKEIQIPDETKEIEGDNSNAAEILRSLQERVKQVKFKIEKRSREKIMLGDVEHSRNVIKGEIRDLQLELDLIHSLKRGLIYLTKR